MNVEDVINHAEHRVSQHLLVVAMSGGGHVSANLLHVAEQPMHVIGLHVEHRVETQHGAAADAVVVTRQVREDEVGGGNNHRHLNVAARVAVFNAFWMRIYDKLTNRKSDNTSFRLEIPCPLLHHHVDATFSGLFLVCYIIKIS